MKHKNTIIRLTLATVTAAVLSTPLAPAGELEDYVQAEDSALAYEIHNEFKVLGVRAINVRLTSQKWRGIEWKHWMTILIPPEVDSHSKAILSINGGSSKSKVPTGKSKYAIMLAGSATQLKAPFVLLFQVPNQPLFDNLYEDDLIAHTFDHYLKGGDDDWPLLLPMVKSATRAMDATQELLKDSKLKTLAGAAFEIDQFIVTGASKRGWTTWLTSAVDKRVCALAPMVIDVLNMPAQQKQQLRTYGGFSEKIEPYTKRNIQKRSDTPIGKKLNTIVDPYAYRDKVTQPKLLLLGTNDPYWVADAAELYFEHLSGPKSVTYLPNAGHGLGLGALPTLNDFFAAQLDGKAFPQLHYRQDGANLKVRWEGAGKAHLWEASSPNRDFRKAKWESTALEGTSECSCEVEAPAKGWVASFVSVTLPPTRDGAPTPTISTPIRILPESFPHELPPAGAIGE